MKNNNSLVVRNRTSPNRRLQKQIDARRDFEESVLQNGYSFDSTYTYQGTEKKVNIICPNGHIRSTTPQNFKANNVCPICPSRRHQQAESKFFQNLKVAGYSLTPQEKYVNSSTHVEIICPVGHTYCITPNNFNRGKRCRGCLSKLAFEKFTKNLHNNGYTLPNPKTYKTANHKITTICPNKHKYDVQPNKFNLGSRCPKCENKTQKKAKHSFIELLKSELYRIDSKSRYTGSNNKVTLICPNNHRYSVVPYSFSSGSRCPKCTRDLSLKKFLSELEGSGYKLKDKNDYIKHKEKVNIICSLGHEYSASPSSFISGNRCPICSTTGFNPNISATLYVLRSKNLKVNLIKVGITNNFKNRIKQLRYSTPFEFETIYQFNTPSGIDAQNLEKEIKKSASNSGLSHHFKTKFDGYTEWIKTNHFFIEWLYHKAKKKL